MNSQTTTVSGSVSANAGDAGEVLTIESLDYPSTAPALIADAVLALILGAPERISAARLNVSRPMVRPMVSRIVARACCLAAKCEAAR
jgi:hypothetical protein